MLPPLGRERFRETTLAFLITGLIKSSGDIIILDEPFTGLDAWSEKELQK